MKKRITGGAVLAAVLVVALRRFGPTLAERGMKKCHEIMDRTAKECPPQQSVPDTEERQEDRAAGHLEEQKTPVMATTS